MSVRNHYVKNCYKIAPMPPSSAEMESVRNAVRRRNVYRSTLDYAPEPHRKEYRTNQFAKVNDKPADLNALSSLQSASNVPSQASSVVRTKQTFTTKTLKNKYDTTPYKKAESGDHFQTINRISQQRMRTNSTASVSGPQKEPMAPLDSKAPRPKSARPESRWQRREGDDDDDDYLPMFDSDSDSDISFGATSAYTTSTITERKNGTQPDKHTSTKDKPARPTTSHGRRRGSLTDGPSNEQTKPTQRPKSRIGNRSEGWTMASNNSQTKSEQKFVDSSATKVEKTLPRTNQTTRQSKSQNHEKQNIQVPAKTKEAAAPTGHVVKNVFYGIDDYDLLDVDPVEYFNRPDDHVSFTTSYYAKQPSLSKDALSVITQQNSSQKKTTTTSSSHGNYQNKQSEKRERSLGNQGNAVSKNGKVDQSITSSRQTGNKRDSGATNAKYVRDRAPLKTSATSTTKPGSRVVSLGTGERVHMEFPFKTKQQKSSGSTDKHVTAGSRQPRRLRPLSPTLNRE